MPGKHLPLYLAANPHAVNGSSRWWWWQRDDLYGATHCSEGIWHPLCLFPCRSAGKESASNAGDLGSISGMKRSPGEGKGHPLRYSCPERIPWTLQSLGSPRVGYDWVTFPSVPSPGLGWWISLMTLPVSTSDFFGSSTSGWLWQLPPWHIPSFRLWLQLYVWWDVPMHLEKVPFLTLKYSWFTALY